MATEPNTTGTDAWQYAVEVWHPDCWVIETTERADVGLLSHGCFTRADGRVVSLYTLYADTEAALDRGRAVVEAADVVEDAVEIDRIYRGDRSRPGNATRELLVTTDGATYVNEAFTDRGFVPVESIDIRDGREYWTLLLPHERSRAKALFDEVRAALDAEITIRSITRSGRRDRRLLALDRLTSRQREAFRLARAGGYYDYPRRMDVADLADLLGVSGSTAHEHLRKAEATLLGADSGLRTG